MMLEIAIAGGLLVLMWVSLEAGFRYGRRTLTRAPDATSGTQLGAIQGATLGLLGLLLGFSFAGAATRFIERQDLIVQEANAIGTAYLRADVLDEPQRSELRQSLKHYVARVIAISSQFRPGLRLDWRTEIGQLHDRIWKAASSGVAAKPAAMLAVLEPVNEVIDLHSTRLAAGRKHLPPLVMGLLIFCSMVSVAEIGCGCGASNQRRLAMTGSLVLLITAALWITIDLDYPRMGLIQISDAPLKELVLSGAP